jgi:hypothetical protein
VYLRYGEWTERSLSSADAVRTVAARRGAGDPQLNL